MAPVEGFPPDMLRLAGRSLQDIEHFDWGDLPPDATPLVKNCYRLSRTPLGEFTDEDLNEMIGQQTSLDSLMPIALGALGVDPWLEAGYLYPGALAATVSQVEDDYWDTHPEQAAAFRTIVDSMLAVVKADPWRIVPPYTEGLPGEATDAITQIANGYWTAHPRQAAVLEAAVNGMLDTLEADPGFVAAINPAHMPGMALRAVRGFADRYWQAHPDQRARLDRIVARAWDMGLLREDWDGPRPTPPPPDTQGTH